ncbi:Holliday junction ATP-dependent DNA helicase RuvB [Bacillus sp. THAF10]|uniref:AAA family ATPase n=1 Tax=Bacillus sp. THAF10 TaxID=2587848 RepID=UPI001268ABEC|nr:MoxR family ATPase [Bacillus sp. THAF10]QFT88986.1 Holliday junction ATP-dependent DNA helicase RuvB [Bacillus sp. THAF10]
MQIQLLKKEMANVMVGKDDVVELLFISLLNKGHVLLESVPGTGKTMLAKSFAKTMDADFKRIQFTPDVLPSDVTGIQFFNPKEQRFELRPGPIMTNVLLADEINRATPRTQSSLLEVMEERQVTIDGETLPIPGPFMVLATQNPIESQQGTFPLPEAQMDRFFMMIDLGYPTKDEEKEIMNKYRLDEPIKQLRSFLSKQEIIELQEQVKQVKVSSTLQDYILEIVHSTRSHDEIELGVSPRGTLALMKAAQGAAFVNGREFITPEDVKKMAPHVLSHRIVLTMEGSLKKTNRQIVNEVLSLIAVPVEAAQ